MAIDPSRLAGNPVAPRVHVEGVTVDGEALPLQAVGKRGRVRKRRLFRFVGLSLAAPARVRYRYRLEGFDKN